MGHSFTYFTIYIKEKGSVFRKVNLFGVGFRPTLPLCVKLSNLVVAQTVSLRTV